MGTGTLAATFVLGGLVFMMSGVITPNRTGRSTPLMIGGLVMMGAGPVVVPQAVSLVGNTRYPSQFLGAYVGTLAGGLGGWLAAMGIGVGLETVLDSRPDVAAIGFGGFVLGMVAGSVAGYHMQAGWRHRRATDEHRALQLAPTPIVDSASRQTGVGLGLSGQF